MNPFELPVDRIATADSRGNRIYLYPADVRGKYRAWRSRLNVLLLFVFLGLPWIRVGGQQAILFDIAHRRFAIMGLTFWAHDAPILLLVFGGAALALAFATAVWGRVWCGWACPQTVFVDGVFRKVERWIEGDAVQRRRLDQAPFSLGKGLKKTAKWAVFTVLAMIVSHSFLAYFVGTRTLGEMMLQPPLENWASFLVMAIVTGAILFDFGWFREQFCTLVCPYGRFQSVLLDDRSLVVAYDSVRGEPRRGERNSSVGRTGDCVNCYRCVQVCPTGIDIRRGLQMECIACTSCMDACDEIMTKLGKASGLIRYGFQTATGTSRPRVWVTGLLLVAFSAGLSIAIRSREPIEATLIRATDVPYQEVTGAGGQAEIINHFKVDLRNQTFESRKIDFQVSPERSVKSVTLVVANHSPKLEAGQSERSDLFVRFPKALLSAGHAKIRIRIVDLTTTEKEVSLVGPLL